MRSNNYNILLKFICVGNFLYVFGYLISFIFKDHSTNPFAKIITAGLDPIFPIVILLMLTLPWVIFRSDTSARQLRIVAAVAMILATLMSIKNPVFLPGVSAFSYFYILCFSFTAKSPLRRTLAKFTMGISIVNYFASLLLIGNENSLAVTLLLLIAILFAVVAGLLTVIESGNILTLSHVTTFVMLAAGLFYAVTGKGQADFRIAIIAVQFGVVGAYWYKVRALTR